MSHHFGLRYVEDLLASPLSAATMIQPSPPSSSNTYAPVVIMSSKAAAMHAPANNCYNLRPMYSGSSSRSSTKSTGTGTIKHQVLQHVKPTPTTSTTVTLNTIPSDESLSLSSSSSSITPSSNIRSHIIDIDHNNVNSNNNNHDVEFQHSNIAYKHRLDLLLPRQPVISTLRPLQEEFHSTFSIIDSNHSTNTNTNNNTASTTSTTGGSSSSSSSSNITSGSSGSDTSRSSSNSSLEFVSGTTNGVVANPLLLS